MGRMLNVAFSPERTSVTNETPIIERGVALVARRPLRVYKHRFRDGYVLISGTKTEGHFVEVPVLDEDIRNPRVAQCTLENAMLSLEYVAGGGRL